MAAIMTGGRLTPKEKSRVTLSVRDPSTISLLGGLNIEKEHINDVHAFGKRLLSERNRWDIARRSGGLFGSRRLSKSDAERSLSLALAALAESGVVA
ncbi:hypothetical protein J7348_04390 [Qipengyuania flava]|uniref:hypothetical protein n=1 Tax=Qipengyuania flava TaxID=192812 RepID=UPI001AD96E67|nr:hypothetical protein [Qipengyuania flava]MBO9503856.1 hypothetical protein [Qipengyuania flava]